MEGDRVFFTSDTHFGHKNIIQYCNRPYSHTYEMDQALIDNWNRVVKPGDHVYHLGDFSFHNARFTSEVILPQLNGQIHLIEGNHDKLMRKMADRFTSYSNLKNIKVDGQMIVLCHYPILSWEGRHRGWWHLHGHCHGNLPQDPGARRLDMGVDPNKYRPVSYWEVYGRLIDHPDIPVDHHGN